MAKQRLPAMLERVRRCRACRVEIHRPPLEYEEVPYCEECLASEVTRGRSIGVTMRRTGRYLQITQVSQIPR